MGDGCDHVQYFQFLIDAGYRVIVPSCPGYLQTPLSCGKTPREQAEMKAEARMDKDRAEGENAVLAKIVEMPEAERAMAMRLHEIIKAHAPALSPKTWYGMPAYARDGKVICFFQSAQKFNARYATLGFKEFEKIAAEYPVFHVVSN